MRVRTLFGTAMAVASVGAVAIGLVSTGVASAAPSGTSPYTCTGGAIPSGNYESITVTGFCGVMPHAAINVVGNINVAPGAGLDAQSVPSTITVGHNVTAGAGSFLGLGCQPPNTIGRFAGVPCADPYGAEQTTITVDGNVTATNADTVLLRKLTVGGNVTIGDIAADWLGLQFNGIGGNATLTNITALDPGDPGRTVAVVENRVARNLICMGLVPGVSGGFIPGEVNHVGHNALGQCAAISAQL
jgi:hypothetical protein